MHWSSIIATGLIVAVVDYMMSSGEGRSNARIDNAKIDALSSAIEASKAMEQTPGRIMAQGIAERALNTGTVVQYRPNGGYSGWGLTLEIQDNRSSGERQS